MSLENIETIFQCLIGIGVIVFLYILIKDRIDVIRSIKPKSVAHFFGVNEVSKNRSLKDILYCLCIRRVVITTIINSFTLFVWGPIWLIDKKFNLSIFNDKK